MSARPSGIVATIIAGLVLWLTLWLSEFDGWHTLKNLIHPKPTIEIRSTSRPFAKVFFVGEKLRLAIRNVNAAHAIWLFDNEDVLRSTKEIQRAFSPDPLAKTDGPQDHRIDVFVRDGSKYEWVTKQLDLEPLPFSPTAHVIGKTVELQAPQMASGKWTLDAVSVAHYKDGRYVSADSLKPLGTENGLSKFQFPTTMWLNEARKGEPGAFSEITQDSSGEWYEHQITAWVEYKFKDVNGNDHLTLVKSLKPPFDLLVPKGGKQ